MALFKLNEYYLLALLWIAWCALHSAMIALTVTSRLKLLLGDGYRYYRVFYNTIACTTFIPLIHYSYSLKTTPLFHWDGPLLIIRIFLLMAALFLFYTGAHHYNMSVFLGISQIKHGESNALLSGDGALSISGILAYSRHPWYAGTFALIWARNIDMSTLIENIILSAYLIIGTILEERKLIIQFGDHYREYRKKVSMFIPLKWMKFRG